MTKDVISKKPWKRINAWKVMVQNYLTLANINYCFQNAASTETKLSSLHLEDAEGLKWFIYYITNSFNRKGIAARGVL